MSEKTVKVVAFVLSLVVVALIVWLICCLRSKPQNEFAWVSECGADSVRIVVKRGDQPTPTTYQQLPISGPVTDIPEFNDCQRFIDGNKYGSAYAIFVAYYLQAAWVKIKQHAGPDTIPSTWIGTTTKAIPVATIYAYGADYDDLGIKSGFNCLFFVQDTADNSPVRARMVPWGTTDPDCSNINPTGPTARLMSGTELVVSRPDLNTAAVKFGFADYPGVARWDFDTVSGKQYIGLSCGDSWCEISKPGLHPSAAISPMVGAATAADLRVTKVKGWNDEQRLAAPGGGSPLAWRGQFIPDPKLDGVNRRTHPFLHTWISAAIARVPRDYKFFKAGENKIELCQGTAANCQIPTNELTCSNNPTDDNGWWARITSNSYTVHKCVTRMDHKADLDAFNASHGTNLVIPGAVRWRWREDDESGWISCETGCCTVRH